MGASLVLGINQRSTKRRQFHDDSEERQVYNSHYFLKRLYKVKRSPMEIIFKTSVYLMIGAVVFAAVFRSSAVAAQSGAMPVAQQNALVQKYCAVCHDDAHRNGGLSLQHFDASQVEPSLAAMMVSKLKSGAMGAAGLRLPDPPTQDGFYDALMAKSAGANEWRLTRIKDLATEAPLLIASIVREMPSKANPQNPELYRLKLTCRADNREAEMQLTWSPQPATSNRSISVAMDQRAPVTYTIEGREKMGNGAKLGDGTDATSGPDAVILHSTRPNSGAANLPVPLPAQTLAISGIFDDEAVVFPFDRLTPAMRQELSMCFMRY